MGVSIHGSAYSVDYLVVEINKFVVENGGYREGALDPRSLIHIIGPEFGLILGDKFITVQNEYYEDYNPDYEFTVAIREYYFPHYDRENDNLELSFEQYIYFGGGASADEVLDNIFPDEFGYEGKFYNE
jgi:hypothetical protein